MTTINKLTRVDTVSAGDVVPVYIQDQGDARGAAVSVLQTYMQANLTFPIIPAFTGVQQYTTQYAAPSATGFSVTITNSSVNTHLILTPTGPFAAGTIVLPPASSAIDKQTVLVNCTQIVTALTISSVGASVTGGPTALQANDSFLLMYDLLTLTWYQVSLSAHDIFAAGIAAFLATPSSANLRTAMTDETGTGALVFAQNPVLVSPSMSTPSIGGATADYLQRGAVATKTISFTLSATENWVLCNGAASITVTLPSAATFVGREIMLKTIAAFAVVSASANVLPLSGGAASTTILAATAGKYATLVSDGANWVIMQAN